jgi:hypothetical protein
VYRRKPFLAQFFPIRNRLDAFESQGEPYSLLSAYGSPLSRCQKKLVKASLSSVSGEIESIAFALSFAVNNFGQSFEVLEDEKASR